jgi:hypothetical protein
MDSSVPQTENGESLAVQKGNLTAGKKAQRDSQASPQLFSYLRYKAL